MSTAYEKRSHTDPVLSTGLKKLWYIRVSSLFFLRSTLAINVRIDIPGTHGNLSNINTYFWKINNTDKSVFYFSTLSSYSRFHFCSCKNFTFVYDSYRLLNVHVAFKYVCSFIYFIINHSISIKWTKHLPVNLCILSSLRFLQYFIANVSISRKLYFRVCISI